MVVASSVHSARWRPPQASRADAKKRSVMVMAMNCGYQSVRKGARVCYDPHCSE